jgi:hypothetical protein
MSSEASSIRARLERLEALFGWEGREASRQCELGEATWNAIKDRDEGIRLDSAKKIVKRTGCNLTWLLSGEGDWGLTPLRPSSGPQDIRDRTSPPPNRGGSSHPRIRKARKSGG